MIDDNEMKVLAINLQKGIRRKAKHFLNNKKIKMEFSDETDISKIPRSILNKYEAVCLVSEMDSGLTCFFRDIPKKRSRKKAKK